MMSTIVASVSPKLLELETSNLVHGFVSGMTSRRTDSCVRSKKTVDICGEIVTKLVEGVDRVTGNLP